MPAKILLNVSARRVTMGLFAQRRLSEVKSFPNDETAWGAFGRLVAAHERTPVYVMADVVEEDFRSETLPHVMGRARREMVARKLAQFFRTAPYRTAWLQGRTRDRRRDDQYLFLALNSGDLLRPYLEITESRRAPLAGIYLLPVTSQALVERLKPQTSGVLLVSLQGGGLRQSFFVDGKLRISRLTPFELTPEQTLGHLLVEEIEKSRLFLYNSRLFSRDAPLQAWVLDPVGTLHAACSELIAEPNFNCSVLHRDALASAFGMPAADLPQDMDALLLCLLGRHPPDCSLAMPRQTLGFAFHRLRLGTYGLAAGLAALAVLWSGYNIFARGNYEDRTVRARDEAGRLQTQYQEAARRFPAAPTSAENMRRAVDAVDALRAHVRTPEAAMRAIGQTLAAYPNIELTKLAWRYGEDKQTVSPPAGATGFQGWEETAELSAGIRPFDGDYRQALRLIEHFAQALRGQPGVVEVRVVELPVNLDPKSGLSGNTSDAPETGAAAQFKLSVKLGRAG
jgi:hypothetical protein